MVIRLLPSGLIATTGASASARLDDVASTCGWPLLLGASPRLLCRELSQLNPDCVLFWLEERQEIASTARLVAWSRERGTRPYRVAVALMPDTEVEAALRSAGAHSFLAISAWNPNDVMAALWPLVGQRDPQVARAAEIARPAKHVADRVAATRSDFARPP
jgi:hypothetical protein